jgi:hypothetical protein
MVKWNRDGYVLVVMRICYCCFCYLSPFLCTVYPWYASLLLLYHHGSANISLCSFSFQKSASGHGGSADAAGATKEEEGSGGLPTTVCLARADGRRMPARIRRLRPRHPQGGAATITYPTMGQQQFMVEPPSTSLTFALDSLSCLTESSAIAVNP